ncbi:MAG TPA: hypothetical protein DCE41_27885 [Cytophagales bacterium]|nr:hypothetical protein [Cytophagales bacterium]HAA19177.1 hypothetical protein [Cytophagales bacterium]HAP58866.1 hypothetical protein [Cytophagales bacterium]
MKKIYVVALAALCAVVACQPEEVSPSVTSGPSLEGEIITTSAEEADALLVQNYGNADFSLEEKLEFLSDYYAHQATSKIEAAGRAASTDTYVAVAQIFDGSNYFTDVDTGDGSASLRANEFKIKYGTLAFGGCNANVYKNGNNIGGRITNVQDFSCGSEDIFLASTASWSPSSHPDGNPTTSVRIFCDIIPDRPFRDM